MRFEKQVGGKTPASPFGEVSAAGLGVTPADLGKSSVITINLEPLYDALGGTEYAPARLARAIIEFYGAKPVIIANFVTDAPAEHKGYYIDYAETKEIVEKFEKVYEEGGWKEWGEFLAELAEEFGAVVVEVYDGYDTAVAVCVRGGEEE
jgi:hypothetical protein